MAEEIFDLPPSPVVNRHHNTGYYPFVHRDHLHRITSAYGTLMGGFLIPEGYALGTATNAPTRNFMVQHFGLIHGFDAGHIIPNSMGGSGRHFNNLFSQRSSDNRGRGAFEGQLARLVMADPSFSIRFLVVFIYDGNNLRAQEVVQILQFFRNGDLEDTYAEIIPN